MLQKTACSIGTGGFLKLKYDAHHSRYGNKGHRVYFFQLFMLHSQEDHSPEKASIKFFSVCVPADLLAMFISSFYSLLGIIPIYILSFVLSFVN